MNYTYSYYPGGLFVTYHHMNKANCKIMYKACAHFSKTNFCTSHVYGSICICCVSLDNVWKDIHEALTSSNLRKVGHKLEKGWGNSEPLSYIYWYYITEVNTAFSIFKEEFNFFFLKTGVKTSLGWRTEQKWSGSPGRSTQEVSMEVQATLPRSLATKGKV